MNRTARIILASGVALAVVVPGFAGIAAAAPSESSATATETTVTVRDGDSLAGLAWRHGVSLSALLRANSLELTSVIHPGDTLVIPAGATIASNGAATRSTSTTTSSADTGGSDYVVRAGDALSLIAWRNGVRLSALLEANNISITSVIIPGQRLQIPPATRPVPTRRTATAPTAAATPTTAASPTSTPEATTGSPLQTVLSYATDQVGAPYKFFSAGPETFDCSGLVVAAFRQVGTRVPHQSRALARMGTSIDWRSSSISAGDLVFTSATDDPDMITHVGIALDSRRWVHAVGFGRTVTIGSLPSDDKIMAVQRIAIG